ncbi:MAG: TspO/MBR family protein [Pseudomonadota bacterium]
MSFIIFLGLNLLAATSGAMFKPGDWYERLTKPSWQPPNWAFPAVWSVLYLLNAIAGWLIWEAAKGTDGVYLPIVVYVGSLALNAAWSWLFFGRRNMRLALVEAMALWVSIALQIIVFYPIVPLAGLLLIPYLCWVSIAVFLNRTMLQLNPQYE